MVSNLKKHLVEQILLKNTIDILCLQEIEVENGFDLDLSSLRGFNLEIENNEVKSRAGIYQTYADIVELSRTGDCRLSIRLIVNQKAFEHRASATISDAISMISNRPCM